MPIVEAVGASANSSPLNPQGKALACVIEAAMSKVADIAMSEGWPPEKVRAFLLQAREQAKAEFYGLE